MKKILKIILGILMLFSFLISVCSSDDIDKYLDGSSGLKTLSSDYYTNCDWQEGSDIKGALNNCLSKTDLVNGSDVEIKNDGGFKNKLNNWTRKIGGFLGLLAIGGIAYGAFLMTVSAGEDEAIKKAKDIIKWSIVGFLGVIFASSIIALVVNVMYSL